MISHFLMRYRLRTLLFLLTIGPPLIGYWPTIQKRVITRAAQITASDIAVVTAATVLIRLRLAVRNQT
jgi:hypothetical protein